MKFSAKGLILGLTVFLALTSGGLAAAEGFLWNGQQWTQLAYDVKVGYIKGIGNLADFEVVASKGKGVCVSRAFVDELKTKTVDHVVKEVDKYYQENPGKMDTSVIEVVLRRCTSVCPPEAGAPKKK